MPLSVGHGFTLVLGNVFICRARALYLSHRGTVRNGSPVPSPLGTRCEPSRGPLTGQTLWSGPD